MTCPMGDLTLTFLASCGSESLTFGTIFGFCIHLIRNVNYLKANFILKERHSWRKKE
jgi:hypothetical protein